MGALANIVNGLVKVNTIRPSLSPAASSLSTYAGALGAGNTATQLSQLTASSWVFAVVDRIASEVATTEWLLYRMASNGDRIGLGTPNPLTALWASPNPFMVRAEMLEILAQHFELVGEMWMVLLRNQRTGQPAEIWPVRPDHIRPVPSKQEYIAGYIYQMGAERIPLEVADVIFVRRPNPVNPYRGLGVLQSVLMDVDAERYSAMWTANFFRNSAEPGGIIQVEESMDDSQFERFVQRWRVQHQGVANAHRVAVLEGGMEWVDRKMSQRDMQFEQLRRLNRDTILGAWGIPRSILGITEDVNRANAEAAEVTFSRRVILPRLRRIRDEINQNLVPLFVPGGALEFDFVDPTPEDRQMDLNEAERGYKAGFITRNEARELVNLDPVDDGDDFFEPPGPIGLAFTPNGHEVQKSQVLSLPRPTKAPSTLDLTERAMRRKWAERLKTEGDALADWMAQFMTRGKRLKIELADVAGYDWDWWRKYGADAVEELVAAFSASALQEFPGMGSGEIQRLAAEYAETRGGRLLRLDGDLNMVTYTRERVNQLVAETIERGDGLGTLQKRLREDVAFSKERARMVARTETATAQGVGARGAAVAQGRNEKHWVTQGDDAVDSDICLANEEQGWIGMDSPFQSGHDQIPGHVNCRCVVRYRTAYQEDRALPPPRSRCPGCGKVLVANIQGPGMWCRRCKLVVAP